MRRRPEQRRGGSSVRLRAGWGGGAQTAKSTPKGGRGRRRGKLGATDARAAVEAAEPFMRALDRWNKDNPEQGDFQVELDNAPAACRALRRSLRIVLDAEMQIQSITVSERGEGYQQDG